MSNNSGVNVSSTPNTSGTGTTNGTSNTNVMSAANGDLVNTANGNVITDNSNSNDVTPNAPNSDPGPLNPEQNKAPNASSNDPKKFLQWILAGIIAVIFVMVVSYPFTKVEYTNRSGDVSFRPETLSFVFIGIISSLVVAGAVVGLAAFL